MRFNANIYTATLWQLAVSFALLWLLRPLFFLCNAAAFDGVGAGYMLRLMLAGVPFDIVVVLYVNLLFIVMRLMPAPWTAQRWWITATNWVYYVTNALMLMVAVADIPFFPFAGARMQWTAIADMANEHNLAGIMLSYAARYPWAYVAVAAVVTFMVWLSRRARITATALPQTLVQGTARSRYGLRAAIFVGAMALVALGLRGRVGPGRPLSISDGVYSIRQSRDINLVLNTPFCIIRSIGKDNRLEPRRWYDDDALARLRNSEHIPAPAATPLRGKNIVVIQLEGVGQLWIDSLDTTVRGSEVARGLMPFVDSLAMQSLVCTDMYADGVRTINGVSAVFGGFPTYTPFIFMQSPYNGNAVDAFATILRRQGYATAFYFGGNHGSYTIDQFVRGMGFDTVHDRTTYANDADFDGNWGIYDHAMGEYAVRHMSTLPQPFAAGWLTVSSHSPFAAPDYPPYAPYTVPNPSMERSVEYVDKALRHFFDLARREPWYANTAFVITADHGTREFGGTRYDNDYIKYRIPFILYTPDGSIAPARTIGRVMSQIDIGPTLLHLMGDTTKRVALGQSLFDPERADYAIGYDNGRHIIYGTRYLVHWSADADRVEAVYDICADPDLASPLTDYDTGEVEAMTTYAKAFLQDYTSRMIGNRLSVNK